MSRLGAHAGLAHFLHQSLSSRSLFLFALHTRLFIMLAFFELRKDSGLLALFFELAQGIVKIVIIIEDDARQTSSPPYSENYPLEWPQKESYNLPQKPSNGNPYLQAAYPYPL